MISPYSNSSFIFLPACSSPIYHKKAAVPVALKLK
jgi:hypothetical protein